MTASMVAAAAAACSEWNLTLTVIHIVVLSRGIESKPPLAPPQENRETPPFKYIVYILYICTYIWILCSVIIFNQLLCLVGLFPLYIVICVCVCVCEFSARHHCSASKSTAIPSYHFISLHTNWRRKNNFPTVPSIIYIYIYYKVPFHTRLQNVRSNFVTRIYIMTCIYTRIIHYFDTANAKFYIRFGFIIIFTNRVCRPYNIGIIIINKINVISAKWLFCNKLAKGIFFLCFSIRA